MEAVIDSPASEQQSDSMSIERLREELNGALLGKADVVELVLACLLAKGHLLLEDLPGLGKTTLAKALAHAVGGCYSRVQCTPDLMPTDITGFNLLDQKTREFEFSQGPVFTDVLLADEINRATPRTQSALFEAMAERQVTIDRARHLLPETFFVIATQNPVESHGAYPLPEAQLDRFAMKLSIGYPDAENELAMLRDDASGALDARTNSAVLDPQRLAELQRSAQSVEVSDKVQRYLVALAKATRESDRVLLGLSPRGLLTWQRVAQARALLTGRQYVTPDDIQDVAKPVLGVRLAGDFDDADSYVDELLATVPTPLFD
ncbi:MAG: MoxR family ATPase [Planctomycetota bacterium]